MKKRPLRIILSCLAVVAIVAAAFLPSLKNGFVNWDDPLYIQDNLKIRSLSWSNVAHILTSANRGGYEPLTELSFAVEYRFFQLQPFFYHLTNLVFHLFNCVLVFWLVLLLGRHLGIAFIAALLFGVHPLRVESVAWVSERKDVLYAFFFFGSLIAYRYYLQVWSRTFYYLCLGLFFLSLLPKPQGLALPLLLFLLDYFTGRKFSRKVLLEKMPFVLLSLVFLVVNILSQIEVGGLVQSHPLELLSNLFDVAYGLIFYLIKLVLPVRLSCYYPHPNKAFSSSLFSVAPAILATIILLAIYSRRYTREMIFAALFLISALLVLQIVPTASAITADRYTYTAASGLYYLAAAAVVGLWRSYWRLKLARRLIFVAGSVLFASLIILTWFRCFTWLDSLTLWTDALEQYPDSSLIYTLRGMALEDRGMLGEAEISYREALRIGPDFHLPHNALGNILSLRGQLEEADVHYQMAIRLEPKFAPAYTNLGLNHYLHGRLDDARIYYLTAIRLRPDLPEAYYNLGLMMADLGRMEEAVDFYYQALRRRPDYSPSHKYLALAFIWEGNNEDAIYHAGEYLRLGNNDSEIRNVLGLAFSRQGHSDQAIAQYREAIRLMPGDDVVQNNLGVEFSRLREYDQAARHYREALRLNPDAFNSWNNLGLDHFAQGNYKEAIRSYAAALQIEPGFADAHNNLGIALDRLGRREEAVFHYSEALRLSPEQPNARANLEAALRLLGDKSGGI